jgi:putative hydrolase of the HAD superfamily
MEEVRRRMVRLAATIFDFVNTLVKTPSDLVPIEGGSTGERTRFELTVRVMYDSLVESGIKVDWSSFYKRYMVVREEQLQSRKRTLREYDMGERLARTLGALGHKISANSELVKQAIDCHFKSYENYVEVDRDAPSLLQDLRLRYKIGLITNFAYSPTIYNLLDRFQLRRFFDGIVISSEVGWVKPSPRIFQVALSALRLKAQECVFVGDEIEADIRGASGVGMKTILLSEKDIDCPDADTIAHHLAELPLVISGLEKGQLGRHQD